MTPLRKITNEHALAAAAIAKIDTSDNSGPVTLIRTGKGETDSILITNVGQKRSLRIYFDGANTIVEQSTFRVMNYCHSIYSYLESVGYHVPKDKP
jgi:hypothetical protein